ncbi:uncharacterized protein L199_001352 [Kwoniella botswanensis]|uniref:uncharacterized protein n=1 Tax=Kwoniella botswanensis TaxID=1268659 RepID=UPI00315CF126
MPATSENSNTANLASDSSPTIANSGIIQKWREDALEAKREILRSAEFKDNEANRPVYHVSFELIDGFRRLIVRGFRMLGNKLLEECEQNRRTGSFIILAGTSEFSFNLIEETRSGPPVVHEQSIDEEANVLYHTETPKEAFLDYTQSQDPTSDAMRSLADEYYLVVSHSEQKEQDTRSAVRCLSTTFRML